MIWIYEGELGIEYQQTIVARYRCDDDARRGELQGVSKPRLYTTAFTSPQLELIELGDEQWVKFQRRPPRTYTKRTAMIGQTGHDSNLCNLHHRDDQGELSASLVAVSPLCIKAIER